MVDKFVKPLEGLKNFILNTPSENESVSKKQKMLFCTLAADVIVSVKPLDFHTLPLIIEDLFDLCDDSDSDVRLVAEENINRIIMSISHFDVPKLQIVLHKIIKKNGSSRSLRAALIRFGQLSQHIRPHKGRAHAQMLAPNLIEISKRKEESIHETLASTFEQIFKVLGVFTQDNSLKSLIIAFLHNLSSENQVIRRCSASCIVTLVQYSRKPHIFNSYVLNSILDYVVPICEETSSKLILGALICLRLLIPTFVSSKSEEGICGSFGKKTRHDEPLLSVDKFIQTYELCLHYSNSADHNLVAAALETLNQILQILPQQLEMCLLFPAGFRCSYIHLVKEDNFLIRAGSESSVACSVALGDDSLMDDKILSQLTNISIEDDLFKQTNKKPLSEFSFSPEENTKFPSEGETLEVSEAFDNESDIESFDPTENSIASELNSPALFLLEVESDTKEVDENVDYSIHDSQDDLYSPSESERLHEGKNVEVGSFTDAAIPLIYCARHLAASFLLDPAPESLKSDRISRVSVKSLALSCLSSIINLYPGILKMSLCKTPSDVPSAEIADVLLYSDHSDPQIRGCVSILIGSFINSALIESRGSKSHWLDDRKSKLNCKNLTDLLLKALKDKSSITTCKALSAVKLCINAALRTPYNHYFISILEYLLQLTKASYWLVKVKLVEVLSELTFVVIGDSGAFKSYQRDVIDSALLPLLGDEDSRVRRAAGEALVRVVPLLCEDPLSVKESMLSFTSDLHGWLRSKKPSLGNAFKASPCVPFSSDVPNVEEVYAQRGIDRSLSKIVGKLTNLLIGTDDKYFLFGYIESLKLLSEKYSPVAYPKAWNCDKPDGDSPNYISSGLIIFVHSLIVTSSQILDLTALSNATILVANLLAGHGVANMKSDRTLWDENSESPHFIFSNTCLSEVSEEVFNYLRKVLILYNNLLDEVQLSNVAWSSVGGSGSSLGSAILPLLSPIKKQRKKLEEKMDDKKSKDAAASGQSVQYEKLKQLLKNAHANYKVSLEKSVSDKFLGLLEATLYAFSVVLEVRTTQGTSPRAEEILSCLKSVLKLQPSPTVSCVSQLLKSLFGTNSLWSTQREKPPVIDVGNSSNQFDSFFFSWTLLDGKLGNRGDKSFLEWESLSGRYRRAQRKLVPGTADKDTLAKYIRLFEPIVVQSLQLFTITSDVKLQANVLELLNQLIQLGVNYCLLDEKQVFVNFVLKQFELIERGLMSDVEVFLPNVFKFLVLLSYEKQHSKPIISIPKILHLCDGLMASDQPVQTHCIPALIPVVEDIFLIRKIADDKELETQREVLLSMLLRVCEFPQVMDLLTVILKESETAEEKEKWKRWSRQVLDVMLSLAGQDRLRIETIEDHNSFINLLFALSPDTLRPIDPLLKTLFIEPSDYKCTTRWLSRVLAMLEVSLIAKEPILLNGLKEVSSAVNLGVLVPGRPQDGIPLPDPFNVNVSLKSYEPSEMMARFLLKTVYQTADAIWASFSASLCLQPLFHVFFVCVHYIIKSGCFPEITKSFQELLTQEQDSMAVIADLFKELRNLCPFLTCQFSLFLTYLKHSDLSYWNDLLKKPESLPTKLVQLCSVINLSQYLSEHPNDSRILQCLLKNNVEELFVLSNEISVNNFFTLMGKDDWPLLLSTLSSMNIRKCDSGFVERALKALEMTEKSHSGSLLILLVDKFLADPRLVLSNRASLLASSQVKNLLAMPVTRIFEQINEKAFDDILRFFDDEKYVRRFPYLWKSIKVLHRMRLKTPCSHSVLRIVNPSEVRNIIVEEDWYFEEIKSRFVRSNPKEMAFLLNRLPYKRIFQILSASDLNHDILKYCLRLPWELRKKFEIMDPDAHFSENSVFKAAAVCVLERIRKTVRNFRASSGLQDGDSDSVEASEKSIALDEVEWQLAPCLTLLLDTYRQEKKRIDMEYCDEVFEFGVLCIRIACRQCRIEARGKGWITSQIEQSLLCCSAIFRSEWLIASHANDLLQGKPVSFSGHLLRILHSLISPRLKETNDEHLLDGDEMSKLTFLLEFITNKENLDLLETCTGEAIRNIVIAFCRVPEVSSQVMKMRENCEMQDVEQLQRFIAKFTTIGRFRKQQFEEIWVTLLSVLGYNTEANVLAEDSGFIVQASVVAIEGITILLKNTLLDSSGNKLIHHGRDSIRFKYSYERLPSIIGIYGKCDYPDFESHRFFDNLEVTHRSDRYFHGLLSVEYLWKAVKAYGGSVPLYDAHMAELKSMGLDLTSCIHLLIELYSQWIDQPSPNIKIITAALKSAIVMSDLFSEVAQFEWLLNFCLQIDEIVGEEDIVILPWIIVGVSKAAAVAFPEVDVCEKIKKLMLRSTSCPCQIAAIQGLFYVLQCDVILRTTTQVWLRNLAKSSKERAWNTLRYFVQTLVLVACEVIEIFQAKSRETVTEEYERHYWSLVFFLISNYDQSISDSRCTLLLGSVLKRARRKSSDDLIDLLVRGIERLLVTSVVSRNNMPSITQFCFDILQQPLEFKHGLQLLMVQSFLGGNLNEIAKLAMGLFYQEKVMKDMETVYVLLDILKKRNPHDAEVVCNALSYILNKFRASDVLTKVIQEFLSADGAHQKILARLLFKVFERAEHRLIEDWIIFSLPGFVKNMSNTKLLWILNCFFISASTKRWLRSLFPIVQSKIKMPKEESLRLLCITGSCFYKQLPREEQKNALVEVLDSMSRRDIFSDLLLCLK